MKKVLVAAALFITCAATSLFGFEWGGLVNNLSNVTTSDFKVIAPYQSNGVYLWMNAPITSDKSLRFSAEGVYKYDLVFDAKNTKFTNVIDLNLLKVTGNWGINGSNLNLEGGRFFVSDKTGRIFSQNSDGVSVRYGNIDWNAGFYIGYTGLLNSFTVVMSDTPSANSEQLYNLCYGYIPVMADFSFTNLGDNSLTAQVSLFADMTGNGAHKGYFGLSGNGALGSFGAYDAKVAVGTENFKNIMLAANLDFSFFLGKNMVASVGAEYASGDSNIFSSFRSITYKPLHSSSVADEGVDLLVPRITGMIYWNNVCLSANEKIIISIPSSGVVLNGFDTSIDIIYNVFSDLQLGCTLNAYANLKDKQSNRFGVTLNAAMAF